jgi:hypothetical protein
VWYDVTGGFGLKWSRFFTDLEAVDGLNVENSALLWLLHHLFLDAINEDATEWAESWNSHKLQIKGEPSKSPNEMFFFSMIEDGPRGFEGEEDAHLDNDVADPQTMGIDWEVLENPRLLAHHQENNPEELHENPFSTTPVTLSEVICDPPVGMLSDDEIRILDAELAQRVDLNSRNMLLRQQVWLCALEICAELYYARVD